MRRTALITGANRGIGRAVAAELHQRDLAVVVTARTPAAAEETAAEIGPGVRGFALDQSDPDSVKRARELIGPVDVLVCNAGVMLDAGTDPLTVPLDLVERTLAVNVLGSWRVAQAFVPDMVTAGWGRVVFLSSGTTAEFGGRLFLNAPGYSLSKSGVNGLMSMLAAQVDGTGVLVNAVNPGRVRTRMMPRGERDVEQAAVDIADVATLPDGGSHGEFLRPRSTPKG